MIGIDGNHIYSVLLLNHDGNLVWAMYHSDSWFHYEEILSLVAVGMMV